MQPDSDRPLLTAEDDLYGFAAIAKRLAPAILKTFETDGMVVGLEGPWGSGKTTLLNFVRSELDKSKPSNVHVINIAPWLSGDHSNLVSSLLSPIADILDQAENARATERRLYWKRVKKKGSALGRTLRRYGARTGRTLAPAARFAEHLTPGAKIVGDGLELSSQYLESMQRHPTTAETKAEISKKLSELNIGFIVILDDLDRLEPEQAVEVVRMVRSVADFPKISYIMCYDRDALSQALMSGLKIADGDQFLQKIVQLTFTMPLPEPFDLRWHFLDEALAIFEEVTGSPASDDLLDDIKSAVDREGGGLRTPREVKLALNSLRFLYPAIKDDVYFPDMCRLHLVKTSQPALYRWIEEYLAERSVLVTGDASISAHERTNMGGRLKALLPAEDMMSPQSIWSLSHYIPGVIKRENAEECVFASTSMSEVKGMIELRRLGSPLHYRHYFALTYPKTVMSDLELDGLFALAAINLEELTNRLVKLAQKRRSSGKSWFEHVLDRLDYNKIANLDVGTISGLIVAIANGMDTILVENNKPRSFAPSVSEISARTVRDTLRQLKSLDPATFFTCAKRLAADCQSMNWLVGHFFRGELFAHGRVGEREKGPEYSAFSDSELDELLNVMRERVTAEANRGRIADMPDLATYLYGWRDLSGIEEPKTWVEGHIKDDLGFLSILDKLRNWAVSDRVYYPLHKSSVTVFLNWDETYQRLESLLATAHAEKVKELMTAIQQGER